MMTESTPPTSNNNRYLERAAELRAMAQAAKSDGIKEELLVLARQYDKLADDVSRR